MRRSCSVLNPSLCSWFVFVAPLTCFAGAVPVVEIPAATAPGSTTVRPVARVETQPVPHARDAADTPAIWVHPTHPEKSLVLGTDKRGGLMVYNLDGSVRQLVSDGALPNDVDVLYDFPLDGKPVDLALAGCRARDALGVKVWVIDPGTDTLSDATEGGIIPVFRGIEPYGTCVYHSAKTGNCYFFATTKQGQVEQYQLREAGDGKITGAKVRAFNVSSICEGCVADNELGYYYLAEEHVGIWKFGAEPDAGEQRTMVTKVGDHNLTPNIEGLALYCATGGRGYLIASSQGDNTFKVYARESDNPYVLTIDPQADQIGDVEHTDGIAVTNCATSREFSKGLFVAHDGKNKPKNQNFKLYAWEDIAGTRLLVDTRWSPRAGPGQGLPQLSLQDAQRAAGAREVGAGVSDDGRNAWAVEVQPLETEAARPAPAGAVKLEVGFERELASRQTESNLPVAIDYAASDRVQFRLEPVLYSDIREAHRTLATGLGDLELTATVLALTESSRNPGVAVAGEVKLPTASGAPIGSGKADYTGDVVLSKHVASLVTHLNLGYTIVGRPAGVQARNVFGYGFATEQKFARFDAVAEIFGHTRALAKDVQPDPSGRAVAPELAGEELVGTIGARYYASDRVVLSLGVSYDNDHAIEIQPGLSLKFR